MEVYSFLFFNNSITFTHVVNSLKSGEKTKNFPTKMVPGKQIKQKEIGVNQKLGFYTLLFARI